MSDLTFTRKQQFSIISVLIQIMEADGVVHPKEVEFLDNKLKEYKISEKELEIISSFDIGYDIEILKELSPRQLENAKALFLDMASCDGYVDPREVEVISKLAT